MSVTFCSETFYTFQGQNLEKELAYISHTVANILNL